MTGYGKGKRGLVEELRELRTRLGRLERRNAELQRANEALQAQITESSNAERQIRKRARIIDSTTDSVIKTNRDGLVTLWNRGAERIFGYTSQEMIGRPVSTLYPEQQQCRLAEIIQTLLRGEEIATAEVTCVRKDGSPVELALSVLPFKDDGGNVTDFVGISKDITELKKVQEALRQSENRYRTVIDHAGEGIVVVQDGKLRLVNWRHTLVTGRSQEESMSRPFTEFVHPDDRKRVADIYAARLRGEPVGIYEFRIIDKEGQTKWLENNGVVIEWDGKPASLNFLRDITERKLAQESLRETTALLETIFAHTHILVAYLDPQFNFVRVNRAYAEADGREPSFFVGRNHFDLYPNSENEAIFRRAVEKGMPYFAHAKPFEYAEHPERGVTYWDWSLMPIKQQDEAVCGLVLTLADVTEQRQAEQTLRERETTLTSIFRTAPVGIGLERDRVLVRVNDQVCSMLGYSREEIVGRCAVMFYPTENHYECVRQENRPQILEKGAATVETQWKRKDGRIIDVLLSTTVLDPADIAKGVTFTALDITERKATEEAVRESEEKFRSLADQSPNMIFINKKGRVVYANRKCEEIMGYTREEFYSPDFDFLTLLAPESVDAIKGYFARHLRGQDVGSYDSCMISRTGQRIEAISTCKLIQYEGETAILGIVTDITERKKAEQALRESQERLKILFESAPDAIYVMDLEGRFVDGNKAAEEFIGFTRAELIGKSLAESGLLSAADLSRAAVNLRKIATGQLLGPTEYALRRKNGSLVDVEIRTFPVRIGGKILSLGIARDITERKQAQQRLVDDHEQLKSLASQLSLTEERERRRLATVLHDHIGQSLVFSKIKLDQMRRSESAGELTEALKDVSRCLEQVIQDTRTLTLDLSDPILYELGFEAAVAEWLTDQIQEKHGIETEFVDDGRQKPLDDDIRVLLFRNVRELLINVVKHAQANKVRVAIHEVGKHIEVSVEDDGVGFDPVEVASMAAKRAEFGLFSIRERLEQLGGRIEIHSEPGRGSRITMIAPLKYDNSKDKI